MIGIPRAELARFERAVGQFAAANTTRVSQIVAKVALDLLTDIIRGTPVDTGRARAGWTAFHRQLGVPAPVSGPGASAGEGESSARSHLPATVPPRLPLPRRLGQIFVEVTNNVRYILPLEFGWSRQAPSGMVRRNMRRHGRHLVAALRSGRA